MTDWDAIEETFTRLRDFVFTDLSRLVGQKHGGNYAVVALVTAACDALGRLHYGRDTGDRVFQRCLPEEWKPAAATLYRALRNGLIHGYETQSVVVDGRPVSFQIAWADERHLTFTDESRSLLRIVAPVLVSSLHDAFGSIEDELRDNAQARDAFYGRDRRDREIHPLGSEAEQWRRAVASARVVAQPPVNLPSTAGPTGVDTIGEGATGPRDM